MIREFLEEEDAKQQNMSKLDNNSQSDNERNNKAFNSSSLDNIGMVYDNKSNSHDSNYNNINQTNLNSGINEEIQLVKAKPNKMTNMPIIANSNTLTDKIFKTQAKFIGSSTKVDFNTENKYDKYEKVQYH